jgi:hypothetical protein
MPATDFASILRNSLLRQMTHKATCQTCKQFATFSSRRSISTRDLPLVLAINASAYNDENLGFWLDNRNQTFLTPQVEIQGQIEGEDDLDIAIYKLRVRFLYQVLARTRADPVQAFVVQITSKEKRSHLVAVVRGKHFIFIASNKTKRIYCVVPEAEEHADLQSPWFVFNDFVVRNVSQEEALSFPGKWKVCGSSK